MEKIKWRISTYNIIDEVKTIHDIFEFDTSLTSRETLNKGITNVLVYSVKERDLVEIEEIVN